MKRTDFKKHAAALMLGLVLLAACALPTFATSANIKLTDGHGNPNTGSIHINLYDSTNNKALSGGELTVYRVAEVQRKNGNLSFEYCGDFDGCAIELGDLTDSTLAGQLQEFLPANAEGIVQAVSNDGNVVFDDLELGLYLVVQTKASNGYKPVIIATKLDKLKRSQIQKHVKMVREGLGLAKEDILIPFSAETKQGRDEIWELIESLTGGEPSEEA